MYNVNRPRPCVAGLGLRHPVAVYGVACSRLRGNRTPLPASELVVSKETVFCEAMLQWMIRSWLVQSGIGAALGDGRPTGLFERAGENGGRKHYTVFRSLVCSLICESQQFLREKLFQGRACATAAAP